MCFAIALPVRVVDCPILLSKNLQCLLRIAPYKELSPIFFTSCRLSQNSLSSGVVASRFLACIIFRSSYQRLSNPGITPSTSNEKIVPLALSAQPLSLLNIMSFNSAVECVVTSPLTQSTVICVSGVFSITAVYSNDPNNPSHAPAKELPLCIFPLALRWSTILLLIYASVASNLNCPIIVSGAIFNARITDGYKLLISTEPIHLCTPFFGYATYAPAACVFSSSRFLSGTTTPRSCASLIIACSVMPTEPIVDGIDTVFAWAISFDKSMNFNFSSIFASSIVSCLA